jgi:hypothetical protein
VTEFHIHPNGKDQNRNCNTNTGKTGRMLMTEGELRPNESSEFGRNSPKAASNSNTHDVDASEMMTGSQPCFR